MNFRNPLTFFLVGILALSLIAPGLGDHAGASASGLSPLQSASNQINPQVNLDFTLDLGGQRFDPLEVPPAFPAGWAPVQHSGNDLRLVQLTGPTQDAWLTGLRQAGLQVVQYIHPYTYVVWGTEAAAQTAARSPYVRWSDDFAPAYKVQPQWRTLDGTPVELIVMLYNNADTRLIVDIISSLGGTLTGYADTDPTFDLAGFTLPGNRFLEAARLPGVYSLQPVPTDGGDRGEMSNQINASNYDDNNQAYPGYAAWLASIGLNGAGAVIANVDGGVLETHPDLLGQFLPCTGQTCGGSASSSHGTHTAGIMAATGASGVVDSFGFLRGQGVAPGASMVEQVYSPWYTQPGGMLLLMTESYRNSAQLSGNSWGPSGSPLGYDNNTRQVDVGVRDADPDDPGNQEFSYVLSIMNGNGGTSSQGTPDEAKNIFTIGSTKMQNTNGSQILDINDLSSNTAHGPALDGRKIPHLVAPGCRVDSSIPGGYGLSCGTSMASPHVSGAVALFIERYRGLTGLDPSPAMIKAAFLPVAHDLAGNRDANNNILGHPFDSKQGWGRMNLPPVLAPEVPVRYFDNPVIFDNTGETWTQTFSPYDPSQPVRLMLVWTDAPGHGMGGSTPAWNNDLNLSIVYNGQTYYGNIFGAQGWSVPGGVPDDRNNTEGVFLGPTVSGQVQVTVTAANINSDGVPGYGDETDQDFALVCYNCALEPDFTLALEPANAAMCGPGQLDFTVTVGSIMDYDEAVTLSMEGLPAQTSADFDTNPVIPPSISLLTLINTAADPGQYELELSGESIDRSHSLPLAWSIFTGTPGAPNLLLPVDNAAHQPLRPLFTWEAAEQGATYHLQVATDMGFANLVIDVSGLTSTNFEPNSDLNTSTRYYWRVWSSNTCGEGAYSPVFSFTTEAAPGDCGPGYEALILHQSDFENGADGWQALGGVQNQWALSTAQPYSGLYSFFAPNLASVSDQRLVSLSIDLPLNASPLTFAFWNWHAFESDSTCWDGGLLEVSTNGGATWSQVPDSAMLTQPYNGTIASGFQNPLAGSQAWCHSRDWTRAVVNLDAYAGESLQLRFRLGTDNIVSHPGWYVDDVRVQGCTLAESAGVTIDPPDSEITAPPGEVVTHTFTITNTGDFEDSYTLGLSGYTWQTDAPATTGLLEPGDSDIVMVTVTIPDALRSVIIGSDEFTLTATSTTDPGTSAAATGITHAMVTPGLLLGDVQTGAALPGVTITYTFTLTNTGDYVDSYLLVVDSVWEAVLTDGDEVGPLASGESAAITLVVNLPLDVPGGVSDEATLTAVSALDPALSASSRAITTTLHALRLTIILR